MMISDLSLRKTKPRTYVLIIVTIFVLMGGGVGIIFEIFSDSVADTTFSNRVTAQFLSGLILEHQRAALGVLQSYANREMVINAVKRRDTGKMIEHLMELSRSNPEVDLVFVADKEGTLITNYPIHKGSQGRDFSGMEWYRGISRQWKPFVSDVYQRMIGERDLSVVVCTPVMDTRKKVVGILATSQRTIFLGNLIHRTLISRGTEVTLLDSVGQVIYGDKFPYDGKIVRYEPFEHLRKAVAEGRYQIEMKDPGKGGRLAYVGLAPIEEFGWLIIVEKGRGQILKENLGLLSLIGGTSVLLSVIFVSAVAYFIKKQNYLAELRFLSSRILKAQEEERKRIARDIHDSISSSLSAVKYGLEKSDRMEQPDLEKLITITQGAIEESRRIMTDLRPGILDDLGIVATINWVCREFEKFYSTIRIKKEINAPEEAVPDSLKIVIFRILQEGLNNVAKYSKADLVLLSLENAGHRLELTIKDNGIGFDVEEILKRERSRRGLGLESMRERAEYSGGSYTIESARDRGTMIRVWWPRG